MTVFSDEVRACARHLGIKPEVISRAEFTTDGGGHFTGFKVVIYIETGRQVGEWVKETLARPVIPDFPRYLTLIDDQKSFKTAYGAGAALDSGWAKVEVTDDVLESDFTIRRITQEEKNRLNDIADEHSENK